MTAVAAIGRDRGLSCLEAAALLGVHRDTISRWSDAGKIRSWRTPGGHRRFNQADLLALIDSDQAA